MNETFTYVEGTKTFDPETFIITFDIQEEGQTAVTYTGLVPEQEDRGSQKVVEASANSLIAGKIIELTKPVEVVEEVFAGFSN